MSSKFPCSMIQKKNKEILILPLKAPLQPKKRFAVGLFSNSRKSLFFPSKQIIMKEIAIMTGAKKYERIIERKQKERKAMERKTAWNEYKKKDMKKLEKLNAGYRAFLDHIIDCFHSGTISGIYFYNIKSLCLKISFPGFILALVSQI